MTFSIAFKVEAQKPEVAAMWDTYAPANKSFPSPANAKAPVIGSANHNFKGLSTTPDTRTVWLVNNSSTSLNINTAPYLSFILDDLKSAIKFDRFVVPGLAFVGGNTVKAQLRWNKDNYASSLGEFTANSVTGSYYLTSVDLSKLNPVTGSIEFRIYYYNTNWNAAVYHVNGWSNYQSLDNTPSSYSVSKSFTVWYTPDNAAPTAIALSATSINENVSVGTVVGAFSTTDPDAADTHTYTLVTGEGSADNAAFEIAGNQLKTKTLLDYEIKNSYNIRVRTDDGKGGTYEKAFTILVNDLDEVVPTVAITSSQSSPVNQGFSVTVTFSEEIEAFILGNITAVNATVTNLQTADYITYTANVTPTADGEVSLEVKAGAVTDKAGNPNTASNLFQITYDATGPVVNSVAVPANGIYKAGQNLDFLITFNETVAVTGTPMLELNIGDTKQFASYVGGTGTNILKFRIVVANGFIDNNGITVANTISLPAGVTLKDAVGNNARLSLDVIPTTVGILIDAVNPTVVVASSVANSINAAFETTFTFKENVTGFTVEDISVENGVASDFKKLSNAVFTALITPVAEGLVKVRLTENKAYDAAQNGNLASNEISKLYDATKPTVALASDASGLVKAAFEISFTFSEAVVGFEVEDVTVTNGTASNFKTESSSKYTALVTPSTDGEVTVEVVADVTHDAAGNGNVASTTFKTVYDVTEPVIAQVILPTERTYKLGEQLDFKFTFSENVTISSEDSKLTLLVGENSREAAFQSKTANSVTYRYTVQSGDMDTDGVALGTIALHTTTIKDAVGNEADLAFTPEGAAVLVDGVVPTIVTVNAPQDKVYKIGDKLSFVVNFSEKVIVTGESYLTLSMSDRAGAIRYESGSATSALTFAYTVQAGDLDMDGVALGNFITLVTNGSIQDLAGNNATLLLNGVAPLTGVLIDGVAPIVAQVAVPANGSYKAGQNLDFIVTFSEEVAVTGTPALTLTVGSTDRDVEYVSGSGTTDLLFRYTVQAGELDANGVALANAITLNGGTIRDAAGNNVSLTLTNIGNTGQILVDAVVPSVAISSEAPDPLNGSYSVTLTFSEPVIGLEEAGISVENGTATGLLSLDNKVFTVIIVSIADGEVKVSVPANVAHDVAQNGNTASNVFTRVYDATKPTVALTTPAAQEVNAPFTVTFTFSENVNNFIQEDITVANGQASAFSQTSPSVYTALITPTAQGTVMVSVAADMAEDAAMNGNEASSQLIRSFDSVAPAGYAVSFVQSMIDFDNQDNATLRVTGAEVGVSYAYTITSATGGTAVTGSGTASAEGFDLAGLDLTGLEDGQLTVAFQQTDAAGNLGADATATVAKFTRNITAFTTLAVVKVPIRTEFAQVPLPTTVEVTYSDNNKELIAVTWHQGNYNGMQASTYELIGDLTLSPGTTNLNNVEAKIQVEVEPNKVPSAIALSKTTFSPSIAALDDLTRQPEAIGTLTTTDADDTQHTYALVTGEGSADNSLFEIDGDKLYLKSNRGLSGKTSFSIRVRTTDPYQNSIEKVFSLSKGNYDKAVDQLKIVNAFSPNGDGTNDTWTVPELRFYNNVEIEVFDRSGVRLFHTTDPEFGWNGVGRDGKVLKGAFFYFIQVKDINLVKKGVVTILNR
ncbi:Ig-like domain-containing protein [Pontibacter harenae]|uniref:Ig-like domain-containing protein n=1 Tax=Pontibacter harenae TaxID=2894083 RepID=UPI001E482FEB|nr:Ig-like domain-containing protein [Pontibacter harenae]MCC9166338.1 Ig-like domain-containing protein [Pontibacter harenae]